LDTPSDFAAKKRKELRMGVHAIGWAAFGRLTLRSWHSRLKFVLDKRNDFGETVAH
jgi:hypothetical protein